MSNVPENIGVVSVGYPQDMQHVRFIDRYAERYGLTHTSVDLKETLFRTADIIKRAKFVFLWNGHHGCTSDAALLCRRRGIPHAFFEWGILPQSTSFLVDARGFCGESSLCDNFPQWITHEDMHRHSAVSDALTTKYPLEPNGDVLVPLQIENDTQILYNSGFNSMEEVIHEVRTLFPDRRIRVRTHPKSKAARTMQPGCVLDGSRNSLDAIRTASQVVGVTSTVLYEAAIMGVPVMALGDHPLSRVKRSGWPVLLAGLLASRLDRETDDPAMLLERINIRPLGCRRIIVPSLPRLPDLGL